MPGTARRLALVAAEVDATRHTLGEGVVRDLRDDGQVDLAERLGAHPRDDDVGDRGLVRIPIIGLLVAGLALLTAACGSEDDTATTGSSPGSDSGVQVTDAWARTSAASQTAGAAYMTITSDTDRAIVSASVPSDIAGRAELHESVASGDTSDTTMGDTGSDTTTGGMDDDDMDTGDMGSGSMTMRSVEQVDLPAGETIALAPGGLHIMLLDLAAPLEAGQAFTATVTFDDGSTLPVEVTVRDEAPWQLDEVARRSIRLTLVAILLIAAASCGQGGEDRSLAGIVLSRVVDGPPLDLGTHVLDPSW